MQTYRHTQIGMVTIATLAGAAVLTAVLAALAPAGPGTAGAAVVVVVLVACLVIFGSLTVDISGEQVTVWFGPGVARRVVRLHEVRDAQAVRNPPRPRANRYDEPRAPRNRAREGSGAPGRNVVR
jgi:hypothetical protein